MPIIKSDYIRDKLSYIESKIKNDTKQELYNINKTAEDIFMHILNDVYGWQLVNANNIKTNFPAIDLIDTTNKIVIQVTSDTSSDKVKKDTIEKFKKLIKEDEYKAYHDYQIKMFYIKQKPNFKLKTLEILKKAQVEKSDLLGIEDINKQVSANPNIAQKVFKTLCEILHDKICDSDTPPQLTTKLGKSTIIGREKELEEIEYHLNSSKALLVHGIGGMGKSTIASYYLHQHKNKFDYYGFFEGLDDFVNKLEIALNLKIKKRQERLTIVLHELTKLNGNKLLVIDDIQDIEKNKKTIQKILDLKEHNGFKILLTSREEIEGIDKYLLNTLS
ncbi:MAG TPA: ATP-binding protein, partial [Campylobacterales bacterium]|nr:ATP-binding protein [Campylobacterales bacterium]